jgi:glycosyltransferase involved in cell wall biosynthesis
MQPTLDIILVNRNSGEMIKACLNSIDLSNKRHFILNSVYIVDDFSTDKSLSDLHYSNLPLIIDKNETIPLTHCPSGFFFYKLQ